MAGEERILLGGDYVTGDLVGGDKITAGDIQATNVAIGRGAQLIVNQIHQALSEVEALEKTIQTAERRLALAISEKIARYTSLDIEPDAAPTDNRVNPYKSLLDYKLEDAPYFFGREDATSAMLDRIQQRRLTVLHSDSGSGKSSLLQAGLASRLLAAGHFPLYLRPYQQPPGQFIKRAFLPDYATRPELAYFGDDQMSLKGFLERVTGYLGDRRLYIFLDQLEELFTELDPESQRAFAAQLQDCVESDLSVWWVLALRKEYFSDLRLFRSLKPFDNEYFLQTFNLGEAQEVVTEPAALKNVQYEAGLVGRMLDDIRLESEAIPPAQVQLVCYTLFEELPKEPDPTLITHTLYDKPRGRSGGHGAAGILTSHMTRVLDRELKGRERQAATRVLEALVTSDMRRVVRTEAQLVDDLVSVDPAVLENVLDALYENRLIRRELDEYDRPLFELTHDYLLTEIELDPETKARKAAQEMLNREVVAWQNNVDLRIPADRLDMISAHQDQLVLSADAAELLALSRKALKRRRRLTLAGGTIVLILIAAAVLSVITAIGAQNLADAAQNTLATATVALAAAENQLGEALLEQEQAADQQATAEAATTLAEQQVADLEQRGAALDLALRSLGTADPETALFLAIQAAQQDVEDTSLQVQRALWQSLSSGLWRVLEGHEGTVRHTSFSHDSLLLASVGDDETIRIWDVESGRQQFRFDSDNGIITTYAFSKNDAYLAAGNLGGTIQVWDLETGRQSQNFTGHTGAILSVTFVTDTLYLASGSADNTIRTWDVETGEPLDEFCEALCSEEDEFNIVDGVSHIVFSPDGRYSASNAGAFEFVIRTLPGGEERILSYSGHLGHTTGVGQLAFSANGRLLGAQGTIGAVWSVETFDNITTVDFYPSRQYVTSGLQAQRLNGEEPFNFLPVNSSDVFNNTYHPQFNYYATIASDDTVHLWETETDENINILRGHRGLITSLAFSPNGRYLASASEDDTIRIWQDVLLADKGPILFDNDLQSSTIFSEDGRYLVTGGDSVTMWELATGEEVHTLAEFVDFSPITVMSYGQYLIAETGTQSFRSIIVWEVDTGDEVCRTEEHFLNAISPDRQYIATMDLENQISVIEVATCDEVQTIVNLTPDELAAAGGTAPNYKELSFLASNSYLLALDSTESASNFHIWELESGQLVGAFAGGTGLSDPWSSLASDPAGRYIVSGNFGTIHLWERETGAKKFVLGSNDERLNAFALSPDGRSILTGGDDGLVRLWELESGDETLVMRGHTTPVSSVAYNADGRFIASADNETVRIWDAETGDELYSFNLVLIEGVPRELSSTFSHSIEFSPLGDYLILVSESGVVHVWYFDAVDAMVADAMDRIGPALQAELDF